MLAARPFSRNENLLLKPMHQQQRVQFLACFARGTETGIEPVSVLGSSDLYHRK
jgi:hypothetical protein